MLSIHCIEKEANAFVVIASRPVLDSKNMYFYKYQSEKVKISLRIMFF